MCEITMRVPFTALCKYINLAPTLRSKFAYICVCSYVINILIYNYIHLLELCSLSTNNYYNSTKLNNANNDLKFEPNIKGW